jgi:hypothetical protein
MMFPIVVVVDDGDEDDNDDDDDEEEEDDDDDFNVLLVFRLCSFRTGFCVVCHLAVESARE